MMPNITKGINKKKIVNVDKSLANAPKLRKKKVIEENVNNGSVWLAKGGKLVGKYSTTLSRGRYRPVDAFVFRTQGIIGIINENEYMDEAK